MIDILRRYNINMAKIANSLISYQVTDRKRVLLNQALLYPIQSIADKFKLWVQETHIESAMTSQVFYFEWFLNRKFRKYFKDTLDAISIRDSENTGQPIFMQSEEANHFLTAYESEDGLKDELEPLYKTVENESDRAKSFVVFIPANTTIPTPDLINMVKFYVDRYKVAGKTYEIKVSNNK